MSEYIQLEGVRVHNLKNVNVRIRRQSLTVICGVSGSGKSSLAFDTLFAEGQRRYVETFSPYARQFLDRIERPAATRIDGIPPAIAIRQNARNQSARSTVGTRTETLDYLRTLFAGVGSVFCPECDVSAVRYTPDSAATFLQQNHDARRGMLVFTTTRDRIDELIGLGYSRGIDAAKTRPLEQIAESAGTDEEQINVIADRIRIAADSGARISESIEQVYAINDGACDVLVEDTDGMASAGVAIDGKQWLSVSLNRLPTCPACQQVFAEASTESLNFLSPIGACPTCEGTGQISGMVFDKVVPNDRLTLQEGAIQPWTTPAYRHELDELLALAPGHGIPVDVPFRQLGEHHLRLIHDGVPSEMFGGLQGFHNWLVKNRYKPGVSVYLNRWRSWRPCPECLGSRLNGRFGKLTVDGLTLHEATRLEINQLRQRIETAVEQLDAENREALTVAIRQLNTRLDFLTSCGLGYLSLDRSMKTLSGGEAQRVVLTSVLGSGLINTLYVLDEPTSGLSRENTQEVITACRTLTEPGNTVVVVEHDPDFINAADEVIEIGPGAGDRGGEVVFQGTPDTLKAGSTRTAACMQNVGETSERLDKRTPSEWVRFADVSCHNINKLSGQIPLNVICAVTGVSGGGKSSLIVDALYPLICRQLGQTCQIDRVATGGSVEGCESINEVSLLDQSPLTRSRRSIPVTVVGAFDEIRKVMAATHEARKRNFKAGMFSFNSSRGGRCEVCEGLGNVTVEMQFLADIQTTCEACSGRRFRPDVLEIRYRDRSIDDILNMTVEDAFVFFNGHRKIQQRLNALRQAGLAYIRLGQPVGTLSGGESQRVRIASLLAGVPLDDDVPTQKRSEQHGTLFLLDEPSTGLHMQDIDALMKCLNHLVEIGHSVVIIEHNEQVISQADYQIVMGPGPGRLGGRIEAAGPVM